MSQRMTRTQRRFIEKAFGRLTPCEDILKEEKIGLSRAARALEGRAYLRECRRLMRLMRHLSQMDVMRAVHNGTRLLLKVANGEGSVSLKPQQRSAILAMHRLSREIFRGRSRKLTPQEQRDWRMLFHPDARQHAEELLHRMEEARAEFERQRGLDRTPTAPEPAERGMHHLKKE